MIINLYLFWGGLQDLLKRKIRNSYLYLGGIGGVVYKFVSMAADISILKDWFWSLVPGMLLLLIAKVTREKIGYGDGWVVLILGNFLSITEVWYVLQMAMFIVITVSLILLCSKKVTAEYQIPFLPFLWVAHTFLWGVNYV